MKTLAIFNAIHYRRKGHRLSDALISKIKNQLNGEVVMTEFPRHATQLASEAKGCDLLISIGGDGTIFEVVNGMDVMNQQLGVIPYGTGNGFAWHLGIKSLDHALDKIKERKIKQLDLLKVVFKSNEGEFTRHVITTSSFGYVTEVVDLANKYLKPLGSVCYTLASIIQIGKQRKFKVHLSLDNKHGQEIEVTTLLVNNTKYSGNFCVFPEANMQDGRFEVLAAKANPFSQLLHNIAILTRSYFYETAKARQGTKLQVLVDPPQRFMSDGEIFENVFAADFEIDTKKLLCCT